jgi:hypothetical protein
VTLFETVGGFLNYIGRCVGVSGRSFCD